jgi:hypothetical protein
MFSHLWEMHLNVVLCLDHELGRIFYVSLQTAENSSVPFLFASVRFIVNRLVFRCIEQHKHRQHIVEFVRNRSQFKAVVGITGFLDVYID